MDSSVLKQRRETQELKRVCEMRKVDIHLLFSCWYGVVVFPNKRNAFTRAFSLFHVLLSGTGTGTYGLFAILLKSAKRLRFLLYHYWLSYALHNIRSLGKGDCVLFNCFIPVITSGQRQQRLWFIVQWGLELLLQFSYANRTCLQNTSVVSLSRAGWDTSQTKTMCCIMNLYWIYD